jgi:hypothetical protein
MAHDTPLRERILLTEETPLRSQQAYYLSLDAVRPSLQADEREVNRRLGVIEAARRLFSAIQADRERAALPSSSA